MIDILTLPDFLQIDNNYPKITDINWYGCSRTGFIIDGEEIQGNQMIEHESFTDSDAMEIDEIDVPVHKSEGFNWEDDLVFVGLIAHST